MAIPISWVDDGPNEEFPDPPNESWVPEDESNYAQAILETSIAVAEMKRKGQELSDQYRDFGVNMRAAMMVTRPNPFPIITNVS